MSLGTELKELGTAWVQWSGGEPTLRENLPGFIAAYRDAEIYSRVTTNGTLLTEEYVRRLCDARLAHIIISIHSAKPEIHDRMVGSVGAWQKLVNGVRLLKRFGHPEMVLCFHPLMTGVNVGPDLVGLVPLAKELGVQMIDFQAAHCGHLSEEASCATKLSLQQISLLKNEYLPAIFESGSRLGVKVQVEGAVFGSPIPDEKALESRPCIEELKLQNSGHHASDYWSNHICYSPWYYSVIGCNGDVFACSHMRTESGFIGNITNASLISVVNSDEATQLRRRLRAGSGPSECRECTMRIDADRAIERFLNPTK